MLLTVAGRPPLCLRCSRVQCPVFMENTNKSFSGVVRQAEKQIQREERTVTHEEGDVSKDTVVCTSEMEIVESEKRGEKSGERSEDRDIEHSGQVDDSFHENFPPQKQRSGTGSVSASVDPDPIHTSNPYDVLSVGGDAVGSPAVLAQGLDAVMDYARPTALMINDPVY